MSLADSFVTSKSNLAEEIALEKIQPEVRDGCDEKKCRIKIKRRNPVFETPFDQWEYKS